MPKYNKPRGGQLTLSSNTVVWGISLFLVLLVGGIGGGMYMGYRWGYDAGFQRASTQAQQQASSSESVEKWSLTSDTPPQTERTDTPPEGAATEGYTDEDIQFLDEDTAAPEEAGEAGGTSSMERSTDKQGDAPSGAPEDSPSLRTEKTPANDTSNQRSSSTETEARGQNFTIQVVSTRHQDRAQNVVRQLRDQGHKVRLTEATVDETLYYRVRVGSFSSREEARSYAEDMVSEGEIDDYWISEVRI